MTTSTLPATRLARTAVLSLVLAASGLAGTAYANDEYGTNHEPMILQAAASAHAASAHKVPVDVASTARLSSGGSDVVGSGGAQDMIARQIYHPGSGTDW